MIYLQDRWRDSRAKLQYESFEQQQRFFALYPRRLETLETLYKKFFDYSEVFSEWARGQGRSRLP